MIGQNTKSSSDSESNSSNDVVRKRKRRAYQSGLSLFLFLAKESEVVNEFVISVQDNSLDLFIYVLHRKTVCIVLY